MTHQESKRDGRKPAATKKKGKSPEPSRRSSGMLVRVSLIVFLAAWMFVLGILVGRGTAPVKFDIQKIEKELAALKAAALTKTQPPGNNTKTATADRATPKRRDQSLGFYETLKNRHTDLSFHAAVPANRQPADRQTLPARPKSGPKTGTAPKLKLATAPNPEARTVKPKTAVQHPRKAAHAMLLTIQVASLKSQITAAQMAARLKAMGYPAYTRIGKVPGRGIWYRVRVGRFSSRHQAAWMQLKLKKAHFNAVIVDR